MSGVNDDNMTTFAYVARVCRWLGAFRARVGLMLYQSGVQSDGKLCRSDNVCSSCFFHSTTVMDRLRTAAVLADFVMSCSIVNVS